MSMDKEQMLLKADKWAKENGYEKAEFAFIYDNQYFYRPVYVLDLFCCNGTPTYIIFKKNGDMRVETSKYCMDVSSLVYFQ